MLSMNSWNIISAVHCTAVATGAECALSIKTMTTDLIPIYYNSFNGQQDKISNIKFNPQWDQLQLMQIVHDFSAETMQTIEQQIEYAINEK